MQTEKTHIQKENKLDIEVTVIINLMTSDLQTNKHGMKTVKKKIESILEKNF